MYKQRAILVVLSLLFLGACASSPVQNYRPVGSTESWQISGEYTPITEALSIRINGQEVMDGRLSFFGSSAELQGFYKEQPVTASCFKRMSFGGQKTECHVHVNNERAATLQF